jgi:hypothetical protein
VLASLLLQELVITRPLWYGPQPQSPRLRQDAFVLDFKLQPARHAGAPTLALLGAARLPGGYARTYGGRIHGAIQVVAIELESGRVYHAVAERAGAVPLAAAMRADTPPQRGEATLEDIETHFNADLRAHLGLPMNPANYAVFLWLDEMTSPLRLARLPGPQGQVAPETRAAGARITLVQPAPRTKPAAIRVQAAGAVDSILVLALDYRSRALKWQRVPEPKQAPAGGKGGIELDLSDLLAAGGRRQKTFIVASAGQALSNVLVLSRP